MPYITIANGLTIVVPTRGTRNYSEQLLENTFKKISSHDHTGSGKGSLIGTNAIAPNAITTAKLGINSVTSANLDATVQGLLNNALQKDGSVLMTGNLQMNNHRIAGLLDGTTDAYASTVLQTKRIVPLANFSSVITVAPQAFEQMSMGTTPSASTRTIPLIAPLDMTLTHLDVVVENGASFTNGLDVYVYKNGSVSTIFVNLAPASNSNRLTLVTPLSFSAGNTLDLRVNNPSGMGVSRTIYANSWGYLNYQ